MKVFRYDSIMLEKVEAEGASKVSIRWLITEETGAPTFAMRVFEVEQDGYTPLHKHPWEHEVFVLEGEGQLFDGNYSTQLKGNAVVFVPPNEIHQFKNTGEAVLKFICLIPHIKS